MTIDLTRREALWAAGFAALAATVPAAAQRPPIRTAGDLDRFLHGFQTNKDVAYDADGITFGNPDAPVRSVATMWQGFLPDLRAARAKGHRTVIVHEPIFYSYKDLDPKFPKEYAWAKPQPVALFDAARVAKQQFLRDAGMTIIRCHDMLDAAQDFGIPYAWARTLGFTAADLIAEARFYQSYRCPPARAIDVAQRLAASAAKLGQPGVEFYGDPGRMVRSVGIGTGAISSPLDILALDPAPDLVVSITDSVRAWVEPAFATDTGRPLIVVNHGASEESGVAALAVFLRSQQLGFPIEHHVQGCAYRWVTAGAAR